MRSEASVVDQVEWRVQLKHRSNATIYWSTEGPSVDLVPIPTYKFLVLSRPGAGDISKHGVVPPAI